MSFLKFLGNLVAFVFGVVVAILAVRTVIDLDTQWVTVVLWFSCAVLGHEFARILLWKDSIKALFFGVVVGVVLFGVTTSTWELLFAFVAGFVFFVTTPRLFEFRTS
jgi:hypothetical protein